MVEAVLAAVTLEAAEIDEAQLGRRKVPGWKEDDRKEYLGSAKLRNSGRNLLAQQGLY